MSTLFYTYPSTLFPQLLTPFAQKSADKLYEPAISYLSPYNFTHSLSLGCANKDLQGQIHRFCRILLYEFVQKPQSGPIA